jgi:hypothetical protein
MPRKTRAELLWDEIKRFVGDDVRAFVEAPLSKIRDKGEAVDAALQNTAPRQHTHPPADVTGLVVANTALVARVAALETAMALVKLRLGL